MTSVELFKLFSKQWANIDDIKNIGACGNDTARFVRNTIIKNIVNSGKHLPKSRKKIVPMKSVIEYFDIDLDHTTKMAKSENEIK